MRKYPSTPVHHGDVLNDTMAILQMPSFERPCSHVSPGRPPEKLERIFPSLSTSTDLYGKAFNLGPTLRERNKKLS